MNPMSQQNRSDKFLSDDEIDALFSQLLPVEPPPSLIGNILSAVANLKPERVWKPIKFFQDMEVMYVMLEHWQLF